MIKFKQELKQMFINRPGMELPPGFLKDLDDLIDRNFEKLWVTETVDEYVVRRVPPGDLDTIIARSLARTAAEKLQERVKFHADPNRMQYVYKLEMYVYTGEDK